MSACRWLFVYKVYKKCKLASLFSFAPPFLTEGGIFWLGWKLLLTVNVATDSECGIVFVIIISILLMQSHNPNPVWVAFKL